MNNRTTSRGVLGLWLIVPVLMSGVLFSGCEINYHDDHAAVTVGDPESQQHQTVAVQPESDTEDTSD